MLARLLPRAAASIALAAALLVPAAGAAARTPGTVIAGSTPTGAAAFVGPARQVPINGVQIAYRQFGRGPDLVLATGETAPMSFWPTYLLAPLARSFRVTMFDYRGMGYSTAAPGVRLTLPLMGDDTTDLIRTLGLRDVTYVGWSMGGEIGLTMAVQHPGAFARIVTSGGDAGSSHTIPPPQWVLDGLASSDPAVAAQTGLRLLFPDTPVGQAAQSRFIAGAGAIPNGPSTPGIVDAQDAAEEAFLKAPSIWARLPRIEVRALITNGRLDFGVPYRNALRLARRIPHARASIYAGAGHGMMLQDASKFAAQVRRFARR
jgi:pimeloyl-ACP methyl ester carboxylesterase